MNNRILVTYATRAGSTEGIADAITMTLRKSGFLVTEAPIKDNPSAGGYQYQAVFIGSAVRRGAWLPEAVQYVSAHRETLRRVRVALFTVHMLNRGDDEQSRRNREAYLDPIRPFVLPVAHVFFSGKMAPAQLPLIDRLIVRVVRPPVGDFREWGKITGWAQDVLTAELGSQPSNP